MPANVSLADAIEEYLASRQARGISANTIRGDRNTLRLFLTVTGNILIRNVEERHVDAFFASKAHIKGSTRNIFLSRLRSFFRWAQGRGYMRENPTQGIRKIREAGDSRLFLPVDEFPRVLAAATHPRDRIVVALGMFLFLRISEIESLRVGDVDLDRREIRVQIHKTGDSDVMPICAELDEELRRWLTWYAQHIDGPLKNDMYLCPAKWEYRSTPGPGGRFIVLPEAQTKTVLRPYKKISRSYRIVQRSLATMGYPIRGEGGHTLRRSGARALFDTLRGQEGIDGALQQVKVMLHHKNVAMTEHYLGIAPERVQRDARLKGKPMFFQVQQGANNVIDIRRRRGGQADPGV